jgi:hypothetical protein
MNIYIIMKLKKRNKKENHEWAESDPRAKAYRAWWPTIAAGRHGLVAPAGPVMHDARAERRGAWSLRPWPA